MLDNCVAKRLARCFTIAQGQNGAVSMSSVTFSLSEYASTTRIDSVPAVVKERAKKVVFDEIASAHFGRRSPAGALAARYAASFPSTREARIFGTDLFATAPYAALANGTAGHGEEVDGAHVIGGHPGASIVHAAVAMAERQRVSGAELINAVVLGYDVGVRIVRACGGKFVVRDRHHLTSDFFYSFGATAAASRLLGLNAERHAHAFAMASFQANGLYALYSEKRHISKSFCNGQYAFAGVSAALMSAAGLEGNEDILASENGLLEAWGDEAQRGSITQNLGTEFALMDANFKFFNAGYPIHTPVEATTALIEKHGIAADDIEAIEVGMPENAMRVVDNRHMHSICVQDMLAATIALGGLKLSDLPFPAVLGDPVFTAIRSRIKVVVDAELQREHPDGRGARVTISTFSGASYAMRIDHPKGHSRRGEVEWADLAAKWRGSLAGRDVEAAVKSAQKLDEVDDIFDFTGQFGGTSGIS